jgi:putative membrane protein
MGLRDLFNAQAQAQVAEAVQKVEEQSRAEVVPMVVAASGNYPQALWRGATLGALGGPALLAALLRWVELWGLPWEFWLLVPPLAGAAVGYGLARWWPRAARVFVTQEEMATQVRERAEHAFLTEEVFATAQRTGMLIFVSLFERQVVVLGDKGIASRIPQERWNTVAQGIAQGLRQGRPVEALVWGIHQCGQLLQEAGLDLLPGDINELPDQLRLGEEKP